MRGWLISACALWWLVLAGCNRSPDALRLFILGAMNGSIDWYRPGRQSLPELAHELAALVIPAVTVDAGAELASHA